MNPHIVIAGGGFAGTTLVRTLQRRLPREAALTLISEESYTTFNPMLPEAVGAALFPEQTVAPIRAMLAARTRFVMGRIKSVDARAKVLTCETLAGERAFAYDELVLALGSRARLDLVPGMAEHALPLKTVGDALHIRNSVLRRAAAIELEPDPAERRRLGRFVVIGGGFSGVEVAGQLADCLASIRRYYPRIGAPGFDVLLLQDIDRLLPELPPRLGSAAARSLAARGVSIRLGARAVEVNENGIRLANGSFIDAGTVICTIGTRPNHLIERMKLPMERGRVVVADDMSVPGTPGLWALGDCALVPNAHDGSYAPPTAQFAVREAKTLARNIRARCKSGRRALSATARSAPWRRSGISRAWRRYSACPSPASPPGSCGAPTTSRRCRRSGARCASSSSGPGPCSSAPTSRTCASRAARTCKESRAARDQRAQYHLFPTGGNP